MSRSQPRRDPCLARSRAGTRGSLEASPAPVSRWQPRRHGGQSLKKQASHTWSDGKLWRNSSNPHDPNANLEAWRIRPCSPRSEDMIWKFLVVYGKSKLIKVVFMEASRDRIFWYDLIWLLSYMEGKDGWIDVLYGRVCKVWLGSCDASMKTGLGFRRKEKNQWGREIAWWGDRWEGGNERSEWTTYVLKHLE